MKRLLCVTFSLFLLITLPVASVADLGEGLTTEGQQTEVIEETESTIDEEPVFEDDTAEAPEDIEADTDTPADEDADEDSKEPEPEEDEENSYYTETISLDYDIEEAIFQIRDSLAFLNYGIIPLICSSVVAYLFYKFIMTTF